MLILATSSHSSLEEHRVMNQKPRTSQLFREATRSFASGQNLRSAAFGASGWSGATAELLEGDKRQTSRDFSRIDSSHLTAQKG